MKYLSMTHNLHHLMPNIWSFYLIHKPWCLKSGEDLMLQKNLKRKWVVLYGIKVSTSYGINEGTVATYGFVSPTNHEGQVFGARRKPF